MLNFSRNVQTYIRQKFNDVLMEVLVGKIKTCVESGKTYCTVPTPRIFLHSPYQPTNEHNQIHIIKYNSSQVSKSYMFWH